MLEATLNHITTTLSAPSESGGDRRLSPRRARSGSLALITVLLALGCVRTDHDCLAPANSLSAQAYDLCFLQNQSDDEASPEVQDCYRKWMKLPDTCDSRTALKKERCDLLNRSQVRARPLADCIKSLETEGYLVNGCDYPFNSECVDRVNKRAAAAALP